MGELEIENTLSSEEIDNLFNEDFVDDSSTKEESSSNEENNIKENNTKEDTTVEINESKLFDDKSESVDSEDEKVKEDTTSKGDSTSPNFYSSIAKALRDEGVFPDLDDDSLPNIKDSESFRKLIDQQIQAGLDESQKRINEALNSGVEPSEITKYENTINFLNNIKEESITDESDEGENLRKNLIYQDFINRGYSKERAEREIKKSFDAGTDIEDAKESLKSNIDFFKNQYDSILENAKKESEKIKNERKEQAEKLKSDILNNNKIFDDIEIDKGTRQKIFDNLTKPIFKDEKTGNYYTALQKYEMENRTEFLKNVSTLFTLTDGFKNINKLINPKVKKEVSKGFKELESTLNNTSRRFDGNLKFVTGESADVHNFLKDGWKIDV